MVPPFTQLFKAEGIIFDCSVSPTCCPAYHKVLSLLSPKYVCICPFLLISTANNLAWASIISNLDGFNGLFTVLPTSSFQVIFHPAARVTYLANKSDYITPLHPLKPYIALRSTSKSKSSRDISSLLAFFLLGFNHPGFHSFLKTVYACVLRTFALAAFSSKIPTHSLCMVGLLVPSCHSNFHLHVTSSGSLSLIAHCKITAPLLWLSHDVFIFFTVWNLMDAFRNVFVLLLVYFQSPPGPLE